MGKEWSDLLAMVFTTVIVMTVVSGFVVGFIYLTLGSL